ncbi:ADP-heptose--LPS heptosyltransferase 2 [Phycisphaerae bacterium RAS1]|nr:ADP-heptose--LPS heptosyltransferase 2 [Phycisphaerae bacterium RAS1]
MLFGERIAPYTSCMAGARGDDIQRLIVFLPNWVGDLVMATPILEALRRQLPAARIAVLLRPHLSPVLAGGGWHDAELHWPARGRMLGHDGLMHLARAIRKQQFDAALMLTNSFRSAAAAWLAGIPRRIGYARDGRGLLLTDRLHPPKHGGQFVPTALINYFAPLAERLGVAVSDRRTRLGVTPDEERAARELLQHYGLMTSAADGPAACVQPYAVINPGAAFGAAKCWLPERFAQVCDALNEQCGLTSLICGAPREAPLMRLIASHARRRVICCENPGTSLGSLKPLIRDAAVLVCNDSGPRHYGIALGTPTVTIFGPTHQEWTHTDGAGEIRLQEPVECGPCQLRVCPLDHRCMRGVRAEHVMAAAAAVMRQS